METLQLNRNNNKIIYSHIFTIRLIVSILQLTTNFIYTYFLNYKTNKMKDFYLVIGVMLCVSSVNAQLTSHDWNLLPKHSQETPLKQLFHFDEVPENYLMVAFNPEVVFSRLNYERQIIVVPNPQGNFENFEVWPIQLRSTPRQSDSEVKTFRGHKVDDPTVEISFSIYDLATYIRVYGGERDYIVLPTGEKQKSVVFYRDDEKRSHFDCVTEEIDHRDEALNHSHGHRNTNMRIYEIAFSASGEYSQHFGGNPYSTQNVRNAITAGLNMANPIFERDLGITLVDVTTDDLVFENPATDPFTNLSNKSQLLVENQTAITSALGSDGFDVGHLLVWQNLGGIAAVGVTCNDNHKAKGLTGVTYSLSRFWIEYFAHELGHQFGAKHNHSTGGNCNSSYNYRFEPGDGSSIMSYSGLCGNGYQNNLHEFFHYGSIERSNNYAFACYESGESINIPEISTDASSLQIPKQTPFLLVGDGQADQYNWIQYDGSGSSVMTSPASDCEDCALFRYGAPSDEKHRFFPNYDEVLEGNNNDVTWEVLPSIARTMTFKFVGRSNPGVDALDVTVTVHDSGPFQLVYPNGGESLAVGEEIEVLWDVNDTDQIASIIDILYSTDGGDTYTMLAGSTDNDGSETVVIPESASTEARLLIRAHHDGYFGMTSTFYDVSDGDLEFTEIIAPVNDSFDEAINVVVDEIVYGDISTATTEEDYPLNSECQSTLVSDVWYKYPFTEDNYNPNGMISITVDFDTDIDAGIEVFVENGEHILCDIDPPFIIEAGLGNADWIGQSIYLRVFKRSNGAQRGLFRSAETFSVTTEFAASSLPVTIKDLRGNRNQKEIALEWVAASEIGVSHYDILGSANGNTWNTIGSVKASDHKDMEKYYSHSSIELKNQYFKISSEDYDGKRTESDIIYIALTAISDFEVYPNPVDDVLYINMSEVDSETIDIDIYDMQGKKRLTKSAEKSGNAGQYEYDVSTLERGVYYLMVNGNKTYDRKLAIF